MDNILNAITSFLDKVGETPYLMSSVVLILFLIIASVYDIRTKTIPNWLTLPNIALGVIVSLIWTEKHFLVQIILIVGLFLFGMLNLLGLGDIKLLMLVVAWDTPIVALGAFLVASLIGIIVGEIKERGSVKKGIAIAHIAFATKTVPTTTNGKSFAFAPCLLAGYLVTKGVMLIV